MKLIAKKHIETKIRNGIETIKSELTEVKNIKLKELEEVYNNWDDPEDAYFNGVAIDYNDDVVWIDVDLFIKALEETISSLDYEDDDTNSEEITRLNKLIKKLKKYEGTLIHLEDDSYNYHKITKK